MSATMRTTWPGCLAHASDVTVFLAPYVNSYKRFCVGLFAPTKAVWSTDNRTAGYRVCGAGTKGVRVECRVGGADLNPYLALAAQLAAGLDGIERKLELEPELSGDMYQADGIREIPKRCARRPPRSRARRCSARRWATTWWTTTIAPHFGRYRRPTES
jgi:glutamine synthetase